MKIKNRLLKYIGILIVCTIIFISNEKYNIKDKIQLSLYQAVNIVKITEEKIKIEEENLKINTIMPDIHYSNQQVERYMNSYIRRDINSYINKQRQIHQLNKNKNNKIININYHVAFENKNILNLIINREIKTDKNKYIFEKDSYVFDLRSGQRIYIDNFLKDNENYSKVITEYITKNIKESDIRSDIRNLKIDKYTCFYIVDGGICVYFNPYKTNNTNTSYEFKIPYEMFENKIKIISTNKIVANVDSQTIVKNSPYINSIINIPIIILQNKDIERKINQRITKDIMVFYNTAQKQAKEYHKDIPDVDNKFIANAEFQIVKNTDGILSILIKYYKYSGGAHGYYENIAYNIDVENGNVLKLEEIFKENLDYKKVIDDEIRKQIDNLVTSNPENKGIYEFYGIKENQKFYLQDDNLVIYFDLYDIAPYAAGIPEFPINIKVIDHIVNEKYLNILR